MACLPYSTRFVWWNVSKIGVEALLVYVLRQVVLCVIEYLIAVDIRGHEFCSEVFWDAVVVAECVVGGEDVRDIRSA